MHKAIESILHRLFPNTMLLVWLDGFTEGEKRGIISTRNRIIVELDKVRAGNYDLPIGINREATAELIVNKAIEIAMKEGK